MTLRHWLFAFSLTVRDAASLAICFPTFLMSIVPSSDRGVHRVMVGKPEGKRPLERPRRRLKDNIKMDLQEVGGGRGDWMELAQDRDRWRALVGTVWDFRVP